MPTSEHMGWCGLNMRRAFSTGSAVSTLLSCSESLSQPMQPPVFFRVMHATNTCPPWMWCQTHPFSCSAAFSLHSGNTAGTIRSLSVVIVSTSTLSVLDAPR